MQHVGLVTTDQRATSNDQKAEGGTLVRCCHICRQSTLLGREEEFLYRGADKSLARPTSRCIVFDCENISSDASLVI